MDWLIEIGLGIWRVTWQPLLYAAIFFTIWTGYRRIKRERKQFGRRVFEMTAEWKGTWLWAVLFGLLISIGIILVGGMITYEFMLVVSAVVVFFLLIHQVRLLSPVYTLGISGLIIWGLAQFDVLLVNQRISEAVYGVDLVLISYLLITLFLAEIILIGTTKRTRTFPGLEKSDRGKHVGFHSAKRLMLIPFFVPIQGTALQVDQWLPWWPVFEFGSTTFSLMLVPFLLGFQQRFHSTLSDHGTKRLAKKLSFLLIVLIALGAGLYWYPEFVYVFLAVAVIGRLLIQWGTHLSESGKRSIFSPQPDGIKILGIVPHSPADEMGLVIGEKVVRVHDHPVSNEHEFYEIMSVNRTYCKLSVKNLDGEIRFVQRPVYENESHELGLLFVKETPRFSLQPNMTEEIDLEEVVAATEKNQQKYGDDASFVSRSDRGLEAFREEESDDETPVEEQKKLESSQSAADENMLESPDLDEKKLEEPTQPTEKLDSPQEDQQKLEPPEATDDSMYLRPEEQGKRTKPEPDSPKDEELPSNKEVYEDELMSLIQELKSNEQKKDD